MLVWVEVRKSVLRQTSYVLGYGFVRGLSEEEAAERRGRPSSPRSISFLTPFLSFSYPPSLPSLVETKLCDPDVNSQAGYFKISGSKDKNCTCVNS